MGKTKMPPIQHLAAEFIGTFFLVTTWCSVSLSGNVLGALAVASTLMVCVYALGEVSGANFNPAVSLGLALAKLAGHGDFSFVQMAFYWLAQFLAAICAAGASGMIHNSELGGPAAWTGNFDVNATGVVVELPPYVAMNDLGPSKGYEMPAVVTAEAIYTALLVMVVLNVATCGDENKSGGGPNNYFGLAIGFVIVAGAMAIGNITQCSLNPAVTLGATFGNLMFGDESPSKPLGMFAVYAIAELLGACIGFGFFYLARSYMLGKGGRQSVPLESGDEPAAPTPTTQNTLCAEFIGTFFLVLTVCLVVQQQDAPLIGVLGIASSLMVCIFAMGKVSGGNYNPAVSFGLFLTKNLPAKTFGFYVLIQLLGGIAAALYSMTINDGWRICKLGRNQNTASVASWGSVAGAEITYTFLLVFVVLNVAVKNTANQYYGLAIGFVITAGGVAVGHLSGGMFNPAVATALDVGAGLSGLFGRPTEGEHGWFWTYFIFELIGGALAAGVVAFIRPPPKSSSREMASDEESGSSDSD